LEKRPLVLFLHGLGADGKLAFELLKLAEFGARKRINIIAPNGTLDSAGRRFWNAGPACCNFDHKDIDDVARISALVEEWARDPGVDSARLYLVGYSNGGFMAHRLACIRGQPFAAVVSIAGAVTADAECHVDANLALLEVHGDADPSVHFEGGKVFDRADLAPFLGAQAGFSKWAERLGCEGKPVSGPRLDLVPNLPAAETETRSYANCRRGTVALWTVHGGNHYVGVRSSILEPIWEFLNSHAR
jgi:polyhydroxybutyrate depolymerase